MTERTSFYHKLAYLAGIVILAFPIVWLSVPATNTKPGGKLAQLRKSYKLSQVNLGEVDPASETIKLATLGLRGVAVNLLWEKANYYKKTEDWTNLTATLEQLAKLQPNFITFWKFQAWNLTYNVSVEFDDYNDRYYYVRRGIVIAIVVVVELDGHVVREIPGLELPERDEVRLQLGELLERGGEVRPIFGLLVVVRFFPQQIHGDAAQTERGELDGFAGRVDFAKINL